MSQRYTQAEIKISSPIVSTSQSKQQKTMQLYRPKSANQEKYTQKLAFLFEFYSIRLSTQTPVQLFFQPFFSKTQKNPLMPAFRSRDPVLSPLRHTLPAIRYFPSPFSAVKQIRVIRG